MSNKEKLQSAFTELADSMSAAPSPKPQPVRGRWTGAAVRLANIGRNTAAWNALPDNPTGATGATTTLKGATGSVGGANYSSAQSVGNALDDVDSAIAAVKRVLGI